uniref:Cytochrome P450 n=1 Tax=Oryza barthii TaxID=65489 RepID=A0A0D3F1Q3_9ORYZ
MATELTEYLLLLPLLVVPLLYLAASSSRRSGRLRLPPGPWALPVIGHLHHLALAGAPTHRAMRDMARRHGPLMLLRFCELPVVVASSPDAAREIMRTHDVAFASRPIGPMLRLVFQGAEGVIFAPYGDGWRQLRKICTVELLSHRRVHSFRPVRADELGRLLRAVADQAASSSSSPVNLTGMISAFVADSTCGGACKVFGYDVPAGTMVLVNAWAIGRDAAAWGAAAEEFSPERFERCERDFRGADFELIPFGAGRRMCPGMAFGLVHVELALAALLFHFDWSLPGGMAADELDMAESSGLTTRRRLPLLVVARPHAALPTKYCN